MKTVHCTLRRIAILTSMVAATALLRADEPPPMPEDLERMAVIEAFTRKQIAADYPTKFKQAADEFGVPVELLMGISFAETRHEHLVWGESERYSPDSGMPRPYGIMSLWDNEYFGHSLIEAAKLIGQDPEVLKRDAFQNMRGAAALLKKHYDAGEKPPYAKENSLESWKYAIVKYCGIGDPEFSHQHAFDVYDWLSQGYDQYGIKLPEVPDLELKEMWEETKKIKEEERKKKEEKWRAEGRVDDVTREDYQDPNTGMWHAREVSTGETNAPSEGLIRQVRVSTTGKPAPIVAATAPRQASWGAWIALVAASVLVLSLLIFRKKPDGTEK